MSDKVKRWVLSRDLNWFTDEMLRMCDGSWFHRAGAEAEKARSPYAVLSSLRGGCSSRIPDDERSERAEVRMVMISWMYCGASPWMALKVVRRILKLSSSEQEASAIGGGRVSCGNVHLLASPAWQQHFESAAACQARMMVTRKAQSYNYRVLKSQTRERVFQLTPDQGTAANAQFCTGRMTQFCICCWRVETLSCYCQWIHRDF